MTGARRSVPVLYSDPVALDSHRVRFVLAEKGIRYNCIDVPADARDDTLASINPSETRPTLVDRELTLYDGGVIIAYLDERYPHPPLMPMDPVSRAQSRLALFRVQNDWESLFRVLEGPPAGSEDATLGEARDGLRRAIADAAPVFAVNPFFLSEEFSLLDAMLAPMLWRLSRYGIVLAEAFDQVDAYAQRVFARPGFQASLSDVERAMAES